MPIIKTMLKIFIIIILYTIKINAPSNASTHYSDWIANNTSQPLIGNNSHNTNNKSNPNTSINLQILMQTPLHNNRFHTLTPKCNQDDINYELCQPSAPKRMKQRNITHSNTDRRPRTNSGSHNQNHNPHTSNQSTTASPIQSNLVTRKTDDAPTTQPYKLNKNERKINAPIPKPINLVKFSFKSTLLADNANNPTPLEIVQIVNLLLIAAREESTSALEAKYSMRIPKKISSCSLFCLRVFFCFSLDYTQYETYNEFCHDDRYEKNTVTEAIYQRKANNVEKYLIMLVNACANSVNHPPSNKARAQLEKNLLGKFAPILKAKEYIDSTAYRCIRDLSNLKEYIQQFANQHGGWKITTIATQIRNTNNTSKFDSYEL